MRVNVFVVVTMLIMVMILAVIVTVHDHMTGPECAPDMRGLLIFIERPSIMCLPLFPMV